VYEALIIRFLCVLFFVEECGKWELKAKLLWELRQTA